MLPLQNSCLDNYTVYGLYVVRDNNMTVFYDEVGIISRKQLGYEVRVLAYTFVSRDWDQIRWFQLYSLKAS